MEAVPVVKGSNRYEEEGEIVGVSSVQIYRSCPRQPCFNKKLVNVQNTTYNEDDEYNSAVCTVAMQQENDIKTVTLFTPQIKEVIKSNCNFKSSEDVEDRMLKMLPAKVDFTRSPRKDTNTVTSFQ